MFFLSYNEQNQIYFDKNGNCQYCAGCAESVVCLARKYTAFVSEIEADAYHYGHHTCKAKSQPTFRPSSMVNNTMTIDMSLTPSQIQGNAIISALRGRKSWNEIDETVRQSSSLKKNSNEKIKQKKRYSPAMDLRLS